MGYIPRRISPKVWSYVDNNRDNLPTPYLPYSPDTTSDNFRTHLRQNENPDYLRYDGEFFYKRWDKGWRDE